MTACEIFDILSLSPQERTHLAETVFPIIQQVSPCESLETLIADYNTPSSVMRMAVYYDGDRPVGYARYKIAPYRVPELCHVLRFDVTLRPEYFGRLPYARFLLWELLQRREFRQLNSFYALFLCASPAAYFQLARICPAIHPHPEGAEVRRSPRLERLMGTAEYEPVPGRPYVLKLWKRGFKETEEERDGWRRHPSPIVQFYLEQCPDYVQGEALATFVRITPFQVLRSIQRYARGRLKKKVKRRRTEAALSVAGKP